MKSICIHSRQNTGFPFSLVLSPSQLTAGRGLKMHDGTEIVYPCKGDGEGTQSVASTHPLRLSLSLLGENESSPLLTAQPLRRTNIGWREHKEKGEKEKKSAQVNYVHRLRLPCYVRSPSLSLWCLTRESDGGSACMREPRCTQRN